MILLPCLDLLMTVPVPLHHGTINVLDFELLFGTEWRGLLIWVTHT